MREPAFLGGDLDQKAELAFEEGHDADIPSNTAEPESKTGTTAPSTNTDLHDLEKGEASSSHSSVSREPEVLKEQPAATTTAIEPTDPNIVFWDGPDDPANPQNWSNKLKWTNIGILSIITLITPLASSMFAPGVPECMAEFKSSSQTLATFVVSVYLLGFCIGPLIIAPLSEIYGRLWIYHCCNFGFIVFTVTCAVAPNLNALIAFRFFAGCFGVSPLTIGGGTIADLMVQEKRGGAMAIWAMGPLLGKYRTRIHPLVL